MDWKYKSARALADDLIFYRDRVKCPICGLTIDVYQKSGEFPLFLDLGTFSRHLVALPGSDVIAHLELESIPPTDGKTASTGERD